MRSSTTFTAAPTTSDAWHRSAEVREFRKMAKRTIRTAATRQASREMAAHVVLMGADTPELASMHVADVLWACRGLSVTSAWQLLVRAGVARESKPLGELTMRQRYALMAALRGEQ